MTRVLAFAMAFLVATGLELPQFDSNSWWQRLAALTTPLRETTGKFRAPGVYDLGISGGQRVVYRTDGPLAQDTLIPCGSQMFYRGPVGMVCHEDIEDAGTPNNTAAKHEAAPQQADPAGEPAYKVAAPDWEAISRQIVEESQPGKLVAKVQPSRGWVYTGVDTILYLEGSPKTSETVEFAGSTAVVTWSVSRSRIDFDDPSGGNSTVVTEDLGAPYPNETITWVYNTKGRATPRVETTWDATVEVAGQKFVFESVRRTASFVPAFEVRKPKVTLVSSGG